MIFLIRHVFLTVAGLLALTLTLWGRPALAQEAPIQTRPELTRYEQTSRYQDVLQFFAELQQRSSLVRVEALGRTVEGRALPLVILANPPLSQPREARVSGKPVVFIMANIHAGEVEGKEALLQVSRRLALGDLRFLLDQLIILIAPIYNADGNERISLSNRTAQNGPVGGVGVRENAQGLDLNRDYIKLEAPETQALIRLFNEWDPDLTADLHTTDGSYHGYHLTYSVPLNPATDPRLAAFHRERMMPALTEALLQRHQFRTYYYGNFSRPATNAAGLSLRTWRAFTPQPRIGQNYVGLRNRLAILLEAYSYLDFRGRVAVTAAFVEEIFRFTAAHAAEIRQLTQQADADTIRRGLGGPPGQLGVEFAPQPLPQPVEILVGEVTKVKNPLSGSAMTAMVENRLTPEKMFDFGLFTATRTVPAGRAYLLRPQPGLRASVDVLRAHGITVEALTEPATLAVERFTIREMQKAARSFQGHNAVKLTGQYQPATAIFPVGTWLVRTAQPLGTLAAYLLEPESDDGLVAWNFLDACLETGKVYPILKMMQPPFLSGWRLPEPPAPPPTAPAAAGPATVFEHDE